MKSIKILIMFFCLLQFLAPVVAVSGDLDDGISTYTDDSIQKYDELGKKDRNVTFIKMNARSKAQTNADSMTGSSSAESANMNSVVMGAGSTVKGDIIIIDDSKGNKTLVAD